MSDPIQATAIRCIFCGSEHVIVDKFSHETFAVSCEADGCQAIGPERMTWADAVAAWYAPECKKS